MKKTKKVLMNVLFTGLGMLLMMGYLEAQGYIDWEASPQFHNAVSTVDKIGPRLQEVKEENVKLKTEAADHAGEIEYLDNYVDQLATAYTEQQKLVKERDEAILELQTSVLERDKTIENLQGIIQDLEMKHGQAYKDMVELDSRLTELYNSLGE